MDYEVRIIESSFDLSPREKLKAMSTAAAIQLYDATINEPLAIEYKGHVVCEIHNEKSDNKDYKKYIIFDQQGQTYITGSESFMKELKVVVEAMMGETEQWYLKVVQIPSKNYNGRNFLTCTVV